MGARGTVAPALCRHRGLVFPVASPADGARRTERRVRGSCGDPRRRWRRRDRGRRFHAPSGPVCPRTDIAVRRDRYDPRAEATSTGQSSPRSPIMSRCRRLCLDRLPHEARPATASTRLRVSAIPSHRASARAVLLRPVVSALLRLLLNSPRQIVLVQNPDDRDGMLSLGIVPNGSC